MYQQPTPSRQALVSMTTHLFQTQPGRQSCSEQEERAEQVRRRIGVPSEEVYLPKQVRIARCRVRQQAPEDRADDDADVEGHGQEEKGPGLVPPLPHDLADHGAQDADVAVGHPAEGPEEQGLPEGGAEAEAEARGGGAQQADEHDPLAAEAGPVGGAAPEHGGQELGRREARVQDNPPGPRRPGPAARGRTT